MTSVVGGGRGSVACLGGGGGEYNWERVLFVGGVPNTVMFLFSTKYGNELS